MKIDLRSRKFWLVAVVALVACGLFAGNYALSQEERSEDRGISEVSSTIANNGETSGGVISTNVSANVSTIRTTLIRKIIINKGKNHLLQEEIRQYDFNFPNSANYQNLDEWSIFEDNPYNLQFGQHFQSVINAVSQEGKYVISLANSIEGVSTPKPDLLFILSDVKEDFCKGIVRQTMNLQLTAEIKIPVLEKPINFFPHSQVVDNQKISVLPKELSPVGCAESQGAFYYFQVLYEF